ncbi:glycosyl hydrolase family protein [Flammeovirgaceae bacterium 311]|nr:glycosyl hydrolase family protein [Flammeovirgaceae bacterium 311]
MLKKLLLGSIFLSCLGISAQAQTKYGWYTEGTDYAPSQRIRITVTNPLNIACEKCPVVIRRSQLPVQNVPERWINIVDPKLPGNKEPSLAELKAMSGYVRRKETNGHFVELQVDDINKDGVWDEIFFMTDLKPRENREFYIYVDHYERGMTAHRVHAAIGNYGRHTVPLWESEHMGWKLWYPHSVDLHGKRDPMLTAYYEYSTNKSGYYMPWELGTDIMTVAETFGSGSMCVFENPANPEKPARAYHNSPALDKGPFSESRFAYDVVYNGPLRSMIKVKTMNWNSGKGFYELEQNYIAYADKSWSIVEVKFNEFLPPGSDAMFGAGIRRIMEEYKSINKKGYAISMGRNIEARIPDEDIGDEVLVVPWQGIGIVVKDAFKPEYHNINGFGGNHVFKIPVTADHFFEYMIVGAWSFGKVNNNENEFVNYVDTEALKYNNPPRVEIKEYEIKSQ